MIDERELVMVSCARADENLEEMSATVQSWGGDVFGTEEWQVAGMIQEKIRKGKEEYTRWVTLPPWEREEELDE